MARSSHSGDKRARERRKQRKRAEKLERKQRRQEEKRLASERQNDPLDVFVLQPPAPTGEIPRYAELSWVGADFEG